LLATPLRTSLPAFLFRHIRIRLLHVLWSLRLRACQHQSLAFILHVIPRLRPVASRHDDNDAPPSLTHIRLLSCCPCPPRRQKSPGYLFFRPFAQFGLCILWTITVYSAFSSCCLFLRCYSDLPLPDQASTQSCVNNFLSRAIPRFSGVFSPMHFLFIGCGACSWRVTLVSILPWSPSEKFPPNTSPFLNCCGRCSSGCLRAFCFPPIVPKLYLSKECTRTSLVFGAQFLILESAVCVHPIFSYLRRLPTTLLIYASVPIHRGAVSVWAPFFHLIPLLTLVQSSQRVLQPNLRGLIDRILPLQAFSILPTYSSFLLLASRMLERCMFSVISTFKA